MEEYLFVIEMIGTVAFAVAGALMGVKKKMDILGIVILGVTTATGGGMIRDLILGIHPPKLFVDSTYVFVSFVTSVIVFLIAYVGFRFEQHYETFSRILNAADAVGLGVFVVMGVRTCMEQGVMQNGFLTIVLGVITGVGGGMLRDIMAGEIPFFLRKHVYCLAAGAGAAAYYGLLQYMGAVEEVAVFVGIFLTIVIRLMASHYKWNLPKIS